MGIIASSGQIVSFKEGGPTGDQTLISDGDYSKDRKGFDAKHNHYGSKQEAPGEFFAEDRGHYTGPDH